VILVDVLADVGEMTMMMVSQHYIVYFPMMMTLPMNLSLPLLDTILLLTILIELILSSLAVVVAVVVTLLLSSISIVCKRVDYLFSNFDGCCVCIMIN